MSVENGNSTSAGDPARSADRLVRRLSIRYLAVLALVALLMVVDQAVVQPWLVRLDAYGPAINLSGRQRMLSQKLAKAALALGASADPTARDARLKELQATLTEWTAAHDALRNGNRQLGIPRIQTPAIDHQWELLQSDFEIMSAAAGELIRQSDATPSEAVTASAADLIIGHEASFLTAMDRIVKLMEREAARDVARLQAGTLAIAVVILMLLIGLGWFVVRPATRAIRNQVDELEGRVVERTSELAGALDSLQCEITEREAVQSKNQQLSAQLAHADRVASMGHLTVGLAHELNQPLGAIANFSEACDVILCDPSSEPDAGRLRDYFVRIKQASLQAGRIVRSIRNFCQPGRVTTADAGIHDLVEEVVLLCRQEIAGAGVELTLELGAQRDTVCVDSIQIQQVLVNLVQNSVQAMQKSPPDGRRLTIRTSSGADAIQVDVMDSGPGFTGASPTQAFIPFHTTKEDGLGIGLAICRSIIEHCDGTIWAASTPTRGAQISFKLPLATRNEALRAYETNCVCG